MLGSFALSLALRLVFTAGFDGLYGQDAYAYYNCAVSLRQTLLEGTPLPPFFWPLGYPALLAGAFTLFGTSPFTAQALSLLLGSLLAPLVYLLTRQVGAQRAGAFAAALIMAFCGQALQSSIVVMADIPALFWAVISAICLLHSLRTERRRWLALSAGTLALACITRWLYLALIPLWAVTLLLAWRKLRPRETLTALFAAALVLLPQLAVSMGSPYPVLNHAWVEGWQFANGFASQFDNADGHFEYTQVNALFYAQPYYQAYYAAPLLTPFTLAGAWLLRRQRARLVLLLGWCILPYLFLAGIPYQNIRFPLIVMPAVAALAGIGLGGLFHRQRLAYAALLAGGLLLTAGAALPTIRTFVNHQLSDKAAVDWTLRRVPDDARLYAFGLTQALRAYAPFEVRELYDETPESIATEQQDGRASYLLVNAWVIEHQWAGRPLETTYHWLRDTVGLYYLDRIGNYSLFGIAYEDRYPAAGVQRPPT